MIRLALQWLYWRFRAYKAEHRPSGPLGSALARFWVGVWVEHNPFAMAKAALRAVWKVATLTPAPYPSLASIGCAPLLPSGAGGLLGSLGETLQTGSLSLGNYVGSAEHAQLTMGLQQMQQGLFSQYAQALPPHGPIGLEAALLVHMVRGQS